MLETLEKLGFLSIENGQISNQDKIILLHIYNSKINGEKVNAQQIAQVLDTDASVSDEQFASQIKAAHKVLAERKLQEVDNEKLGSSRLFEKMEERVQGLKGAFEEKKIEFETMRGVLENEQNFDAFCQKTNLSANKDMVKKALQKKFDDTKADYLKQKVGCLSVGVDFAAWADARAGKYSLAL